MKRRDGTFAGAKGTVYWRAWEPEGQVRGIALVLHGYAEHGERYAHVAATLADQGFATYAPDHLGHGRSDGERALITDFDGVVDDAAAVCALAIADHPGAPVVVIGHSMGGLVASLLVQRGDPPVAGLALLGAVLGDWKWAREVLAADTLPEGASDPAGMSRDPAAQADYAADPLVYHGAYKRPLLEAELAALDRSTSRLGEIAVPLAVFHGTDDPFVPPGPTLAAAAATSAPWRRVYLYEGARHELVNETNRAEVLADLARFCRDAIAGARG